MAGLSAGESVGQWAASLAHEMAGQRVFPSVTILEFSLVPAMVETWAVLLVFSLADSKAIASVAKKVSMWGSA